MKELLIAVTLHLQLSSLRPWREAISSDNPSRVIVPGIKPTLTAIAHL